MAEETVSTEVAQAQEPKAEETQLSLSERMEKSVTEQWQRAATEESASAEKSEAATGQEAPAGSEEKAEGATEQESEKFEATAEQLADTKFWGGLDKAGWERMEKHYPVQTALVKAAQAAGTRIVNEARKTTAQQPAQTADDKPAAAQTSPEFLDAIRRANSLDDAEAAKGLKDIIKLTLSEQLPEYGLDPARALANKVASTAYATVVAQAPEIANLDLKELDAAVENDPALVSLLEAAQPLPTESRIAITAGVMRKAADAVKASKATAQAAADAEKARQTEKAKEKQRKVNSNALIPSNTVVESPSGGTKKGKETREEFVNRKFAEAVASEQSVGR